MDSQQNSDRLIVDAINQNRGPSALPLIEYRKMLALEEIAITSRLIEEALQKAVVLMEKSTIVLPTRSPRMDELVEMESMLNSDQPPTEIGPALQHRRRRAAPGAD